MLVVKPITIKCENCDQLIEVETDVDCIGRYERQMGEECEYEAVAEEDCHKCGSLLYVKMSIWEYPVGALNNLETEVDGAKIIGEPVISLHG